MIDGQVERQDKGEIKSETKRKEQQMTGQMQRHGDRWMVKTYRPGGPWACASPNESPWIGSKMLWA